MQFMDPELSQAEITRKAKERYERLYTTLEKHPICRKAAVQATLQPSGTLIHFQTKSGDQISVEPESNQDFDRLIVTRRATDPITGTHSVEMVWANIKYGPLEPSSESKRGKPIVAVVQYYKTLPKAEEALHHNDPEAFANFDRFLRYLEPYKPSQYCPSTPPLALHPSPPPTFA
jgi:hypothetical protein